MDPYDDDVRHAYRKGFTKGRNIRPIVVRCSSSLRSRIFNYAKHLQGLKNNNNHPYFVTQHLPEQYFCEKKEHLQQIKQLKEKNKTLAADKQIKFSFKGRALMVNEKQQKKYVAPQLFGKFSLYLKGNMKK